MPNFTKSLGHIQEDSGADFLLSQCLFYYGCFTMHLAYRGVFVSKSKLMCWYYLLSFQYCFSIFRGSFSKYIMIMVCRKQLQQLGFLVSVSQLLLPLSNSQVHISVYICQFDKVFFRRLSQDFSCYQIKSRGLLCIYACFKFIDYFLRIYWGFMFNLRF